MILLAISCRYECKYKFIKKQSILCDWRSTAISLFSFFFNLFILFFLFFFYLFIYFFYLFIYFFFLSQHCLDQWKSAYGKSIGYILSCQYQSVCLNGSRAEAIFCYLSYTMPLPLPRSMKSDLLQIILLDLANMFVCTKFYQITPYDWTSMVISIFSRFWPRRWFGPWKVIYDKPISLILSVSIYLQKMIKVFLTVSDMPIFASDHGRKDARTHKSITLRKSTLVGRSTFYAGWALFLTIIASLSSSLTVHEQIHKQSTDSSVTVHGQTDKVDYRTLFQPVDFSAGRSISIRQVCYCGIEMRSLFAMIYGSSSLSPSQSLSSTTTTTTTTITI